MLHPTLNDPRLGAEDDLEAMRMLVTEQAEQIARLERQLASGAPTPPSPMPRATLPHAVPDEAWERIRPLIPGRAERVPRGRARLDDRAVLDGIVHVLMTGIGWCALPKSLGCGSGMTCWRRWREWQSGGVWPGIAGIVAGTLPVADRARFLFDAEAVIGDV